MIEDANDPHLLLRTLVSYGIVVIPVDDRHDLYTARCPFTEHPDTVDTIAGHRDTVAAHPISAAIADQIAEGWRDRQEWRPAFNLRPLHGVFHCFGCGHHGTTIDLAAHFAARQEAG